MQSAFQPLALLYVLDAPTVRADGPLHNLAGPARARLRARDELDALSALLAVLRLVLVMHGLLGRLALRERRPRTGRCGEDGNVCGEDGNVPERDPAGDSHATETGHRKCRFPKNQRGRRRAWSAALEEGGSEFGSLQG